MPELNYCLVKEKERRSMRLEIKLNSVLVITEYIDSPFHDQILKHLKKI